MRLSRNAVRGGVLDAIGTVSLLGFSLLTLFIGVRGFSSVPQWLSAEDSLLFLVCWPQQHSISFYLSAISVASL